MLPQGILLWKTQPHTGQIVSPGRDAFSLEQKLNGERVCKVFVTMSDIMLNCRICVTRFSPMGTECL